MGSLKQPSLSGELFEWLRPGRGRVARAGGFQGDQESLPMTWQTALHAGTARVQTGDPEPRGVGSPHCQRAKLPPSPEGEEADCAGRGAQAPFYPLPGLGCIVHAAAGGRPGGSGPASGQPRAALMPPRPHELTFTKLSASGKPGSTISPSDFDRARGRLGLDSRGLGAAIFPAMPSRECFASATCAHCACAEAVLAGKFELGRNQPESPHQRRPHLAPTQGG